MCLNCQSRTEHCRAQRRRNTTYQTFCYEFYINRGGTKFNFYILLVFKLILCNLDYRSEGYLNYNLKIDWFYYLRYRNRNQNYILVTTMTKLIYGLLLGHFFSDDSYWFCFLFRVYMLTDDMLLLSYIAIVKFYQMTMK